MAGTPPTYNGQTNDFTGKGTTNPEKLTLPYLDQVPDQQTKATLLKIQQYINNLLAPTGGGAYASLTGPGETTTPGALTQLGDFTVDDLTGSGSGITLRTASTSQLPIFLTASDGVLGGNLATVTLSTTGGAAEVNMQAGTGSGANIAISSTGVGPGTIQIFTSKLGFFGHAPNLRPNVTGSRGGNAALASLLTGLDALGLIVDSTTP